MSMNPPQPPQPPAQPPVPPGAQPPAAEPPVPAEEARRKQRNLIIGGVIGALVLAVAGFFVGKTIESNKYDPGQPAYNAIYTKGAQSGSAVGTAKGQKEGKQEGIAEGTEQGKKTGLKQGQQEGVAQGQQEGADAALGGLDGWDTDTPYIVEFNEGPNENVPFAVQDRTLMQAGVLYKICNSGTGVCVAQPSSNSSSSGGPTAP